MPSSFRRGAIAAALWLAAVGAAVAPLPAAAQAFPSKQIKLVIPFPPGGSTDIVGRQLAKRMSEEFGQQVIVENRAGAGGGVGTQAVAKSEPDGHTLVFIPAGPITVAPHVNKDLGYRMSDLVPVAIAFRTPFLLVVPANSPHKSLADLLETGKAARGAPAAYGSSGNGALSHLGSEMLNAAAGTAFVHVPYKGTPGTLQALLSGDVQWALVTGNDGKAMIEGGRLRALAVMSQKRAPLFPQVPGMGELGIRSIDLDVWFGLFAPSRLPPATLELMSRTVRKILAEPEFNQRMREMGGEVPSDANTPVSITAALERESVEFGKVVKAIGVKVD